jgi:hypothetical protein
MRYRKHISRIAVLLGVIALLGGCSSIPLKPREELSRARIETYAGQSIDHFTWPGRYAGWQPMSANEVLVSVASAIRRPRRTPSE